ncbi:response regulator transcription factor [Spirosoma taeanense]|uniref:Response regulator transcription factor n=1 Tax=Spirosoma taeanense TaxID=2735870 RepID=A0A6M5YC38_9BACT|nr:response regulator transcription factor [Spirosoma taeanense]QJW91539.1 response regulator transcription factor [Spirosoma taeanense]
MKLLVVEDEPKTLQAIQQGLEESQFEVDIAYDGLIAKRLALKNDYAAIITDLVLPGLNGYELCRQLRAEGLTTPLLILTALSGTDDVVTGFDAGADQYLTKPFQFGELLARVRSLTKRNRQVAITAQILRYGGVEINLDAKTVTRDGRAIDLTAREFALLQFLMHNKGRVLSKPEIAEHVWDINFDTGTNVVEVYINYLRKKMDKDFPQKLIHTHFGMGYMFREE